MSLWHKPIGSITFDDLDEFCKADLEESVRLDYKGDWPNDLAKTMAAMANTVGGMILLGVDADKNTNKPIWPPQPIAPPRKGLPTVSGLSERVYQLARDAIYPPLMPEVSSVIGNTFLPGAALIVIRIPQSKDAPHATDGKKNVYIYERTGNQNFAHRHADIDYIANLLHRREKIEEEREQIIQNATRRGIISIADTACPLRWFSVIPYYPWRPVATPAGCFEFHTTSWGNGLLAPHCQRFQIQRAPGGSYGVAYDILEDQRAIAVACNSVSIKGHLFCLNTVLEYAHDPKWSGKFNFGFTRDLLMDVIKEAQQFYASAGADAPMYLKVSLGVLNARGLVLDMGARTLPLFSPARFPDDNFRAETDLLGIEGLPESLAKPLLDQLLFEFGIPV